MRGTWSFYDAATGHLTGSYYSGHERHLPTVTPQGCGAIAGEHDHLSRRVDLATREAVEWQPDAPADTADEVYVWSEGAQRWVATPTLSRLKRDAHYSIDAAAGEARLRFITDVAGQQAVYLLKLDEARAVAAGGTDATPHIDSEAAATGVTREQLAATVIATAQSWNEVVSPAIEAARIGGKAAVTAAGDGESVATALDAALAALAAITP